MAGARSSHSASSSWRVERVAVAPGAWATLCYPPNHPVTRLEADPGLTRPKVGDADQGTPAIARTRPGNADAALISLLVAGLVFRIIIAYAFAGAGFKADLVSFQYWA